MPSPIDRLNPALEGRYALERELGQGGMATVYLAEDLRHRRKVALKVLKPELAAVVGADRFLGEIATTARLQHPNILPLFDSGRADGFLFYVMPYVAGETLRERLDRDHQLPVDDAVRIAISVAQALDYAHRQGVIHRDIKPANVLIHDGQPVISDFGIALALSAGGAGRLTETGLSLGTPHYMSPEQATGDQRVGPATDIYALGCVLYEMLVGEPPYVGSTPQAVLGKIITEPAPSAAKHRKSVPANVDAAIRKALEKLPADRFTGANAFAKALEDAAFRHGAPEAEAFATQLPWRRLALAGWGVAAVAIGALGYTIARPGPALPIERFAMPFESPATPAILPDGSGIVIAQPTEEGRAQLWLRTWDELTPRPIAGTEGLLGGTASVSPDGRQVAFTANGQLRVAFLTGGGVRELADGSFCCERWSEDGYIYFSAFPDRNIRRVRATGGPIESVTEAEVQRVHSHYQAIPDRDVAVMHVAAGTGSDARVLAVRTSTGERREIVPGASPSLTRTGHLLWVTEQGQLQGAQFDPVRLELSGPPVTLLEGVNFSPLGGSSYSVSETGSLVYVAAPPGGGDSDEYEFVWVSRAGEVAPVDSAWTFAPGAGTAGWSLSPDGGRVAVRELTGDDWGIWIKQLPTGPRTRLTFAEGLHRMPRWSPDGRAVTYLTGEGGDLNVWSKRADGTGEASLLFDFETGLAEGFLTPAGDWLLLRVGAGADLSLRDIYGVPPGDTVAMPLVATSEFAEESPEVSPDGRWLAYVSTETGRTEVYVRPFPDVEADKVPISTDGGVSPLWSRDGGELFYVNPTTRELMVAEIRTTPRFEIVQTRTLFTIPPDLRLNRIEEFYDVAPDGQRFLMARRVSTDAGSAGELILVQNWFEELQTRVRN